MNNQGLKHIENCVPTTWEIELKSKYSKYFLYYIAQKLIQGDN